MALVITIITNNHGRIIEINPTANERIRIQFGLYDSNCSLVIFCFPKDFTWRDRVSVNVPLLFSFWEGVVFFRYPPHDLQYNLSSLSIGIPHEGHVFALTLFDPWWMTTFVGILLKSEAPQRSQNWDCSLAIIVLHLGQTRSFFWGGITGNLFPHLLQKRDSSSGAGAPHFGQNCTIYFTLENLFFKTYKIYELFFDKHEIANRFCHSHIKKNYPNHYN